jgi:hypothetical protein
MSSSARSLYYQDWLAYGPIHEPLTLSRSGIVTLWSLIANPENNIRSQRPEVGSRTELPRFRSLVTSSEYSLSLVSHRTDLSVPCYLASP